MQRCRWAQGEAQCDGSKQPGSLEGACCSGVPPARVPFILPACYAIFAPALLLQTRVLANIAEWKRGQGKKAQ